MRHSSGVQLYLTPSRHVSVRMNDRNVPLISIVMATYNGSRYIREQVDSLLAQTYPNLELLVIDDGSSDDTVAIMQGYAAQHANIRLMINEQNLGYIKTFEKGMLEARGTFIALCDQDDFWLPEKIDLLYANIGESLLIYSDSELVDGNMQSFGLNFSYKKNMRSYNNCLVFVTDNCIPGHTVLMHRRLVEIARPFPPTIPHDHWLAFVASMNGGVKFLDKPLVRYRNHDSNVFGLIRTKESRQADKEREKKHGSHRVRKLENLHRFYDKCKPEMQREKKVIRALIKAYSGYSLSSNFVRMVTFFAHRDELLAIKKRNGFRKFLYCFKMFVKTH